MKLCECGCGEPAPIAKRTDPRHGHVKGQPIRFIKGHNNAKQICKRGHARTVENVYKSGACKLCVREYQNTEAYKQSMREYMREYNQTEAGKHYRQEYKQREAVKQRSRSRQRVYNQTEAGQIVTANANARRRDAVGEVTVEEWRAICAITNDCCACCGLNRLELYALGRVLCRDHIVPIVHGGTNNADNVQPLCHSTKLGSMGGCNNIKSDKIRNYLKDWMSRREADHVVFSSGRIEP